MKSHSRKRANTRHTIGDFFRAKKGQREKGLEESIHQHLVRLESLDKNNREFWRNYQSFLALEREKVLSRILESLWQAGTSPFVFEGGRIVGSQYSTNPLCSVGSAAYPGRFNFAKIASYLPDFQALYLASDFETAFCEKFFLRSNDNTGKLTSSELSLAPLKSFAFYRLEAKFDSVLDIRNDAALAGFCEIIAKIDPSVEILMAATRVHSNSPRTIKTVEQLRAALLEENFQQWAAWVDQPSPSQWFGHYVKAAGMQGIIYPSVRNPDGFNLAVFPDNFRDTDAEVSLIDPADSVLLADRKLNKENYLLLQNSACSNEMRH